jgi:hypothetical protein
LVIQAGRGIARSGGGVGQALLRVPAVSQTDSSFSSRRLEPMRLRHPIFAFLGLLAMGCTSFDVNNEGGSRRVLLGKTFTISLPGASQVRLPAVARPDVVTFVDRKEDPASDQSIFLFKAIGVGESEITIPKVNAPPGSPPFSMTIEVTLGGQPY